MMSALAELGRLGRTALGESQSEADAIHQRVVKVLDEEARCALAARPLPDVASTARGR